MYREREREREIEIEGKNERRLIKPCHWIITSSDKVIMKIINNNDN